MLTIPRRSETARGTAFVEAGRGDPLVLIHGVGMRLEAWAPQIAALSNRRRVIALDMPGHGDSRPLPAGSTLGGFVEWFGATIDDLGLDRVAVAGHSMGAMIAGGAAATFGARISHVALLNGVFRRSPQARSAVLARAADISRGVADLQGPLTRWFADGEEGSEPYRLVRDFLSRVDREGYATAYSAFAKGDEAYADAWGRVACPALFLTGRDDPNSTPEMAEAMAAAAPNGRAMIVEGHRHMVNLTAPDEVNRILGEWLDERRMAA